MNFASAFASSHPYSVGLLITALVSVLYSRLDKYPRVHGLFLALAGAGFDLPKITGGIVQAVTGKPYVPSVAKVAAPKPPSAPPTAVALALAAFALLGGSAACTATERQAAEQDLSKVETGASLVLGDVTKGCALLEAVTDAGSIARVCLVDNKLVVFSAPGFTVAGQALDGGVQAIDPATFIAAVQAGQGVVQSVESGGAKDAGADR